MAVLLAGCGSATASKGDAAAIPAALAPAEVRYWARIEPPRANDEGVTREALAGARRHLGQALVRTGGAPASAREAAPGPDRPSFVFHVTVTSLAADHTGRTRASVSTVVRTEAGGRIVGALSGTATAYVERSAPLAVRQERAIDGAIDGALRRWPELLARLESGDSIVVSAR